MIIKFLIFQSLIGASKVACKLHWIDYVPEDKALGIADEIGMTDVINIIWIIIFILLLLYFINNPLKII